MKISARQVQAVLRARQRGPARAGDAAPPPEEPAERAEVAELAAKVREMPDVRDTVVFPIRSRLRRGAYYVPGRRIVDVLLGRLAADLLKR